MYVAMVMQIYDKINVIVLCRLLYIWNASSCLKHYSTELLLRVGPFYEAHVNPTLNESLVILRFQHGDALKYAIE